jgi:hypothetical protein
MRQFEKHHLDKIIKETDNLTKDRVTIGTGTIFQDSISLSIAAEKLGYDAEPDGFDKWGWPVILHLQKRSNIS